MMAFDLKIQTVGSSDLAKPESFEAPKTVPRNIIDISKTNNVDINLTENLTQEMNLN